MRIYNIQDTVSNPIAMDGKLNVTSLTQNGGGASWVKGRDIAPFKTITNPTDAYSNITSLKTASGSWEMGTYNSGSQADRLNFVYATDANYSSNTNTVFRVYLEGQGSGTYKFWHSGNMTYSLSGTTLTITTS